ncbi:MAG: hypothetical protein JSV37_09180 [Anaerolineaceae bacterium]|nr:MAG: hypothetical protein JSV37_09180 [Anaerolineaceae bacterium]
MNCPTHWRLRHLRYRLLGARCVGCDQPLFPPRPLCPTCTSLSLVTSALTGFEAIVDYPLRNLSVGNEGLQEVDLSFDYLDVFDQDVFN